MPKLKSEGKNNYQIKVAFGTGLNTILECTLSYSPREKPNREMTKKGRFKRKMRKLLGVLKKNPSDYNICGLNEIKKKLELVSKSRLTIGHQRRKNK